MNRYERILNKLSVLEPVEIKLINNSEAHAGHSQHLGEAARTGETHYRLIIVSEQFKGLSRIDRQRAVMDLLKEEFTAGLHALEIKARAPDEMS